MPEEKKFIMKHGTRVVTLREALNDNWFSASSRQRVWLYFDDETKIELHKNDRKTLPQYLDYGIKSHSTTSGIDIYRISEIPEDFYEELAIEKDKQLLRIKRILEGRWGYAKNGRIIFEMPDGSYKYINEHTKPKQLKENDLKPVESSWMLTVKYMETLTGPDVKFLCMMYGLKICGDDNDDERKED